jgi:formate dehydrogenase iron-sulfur subunit
MLACPFNIPRYEWKAVLPKVKKCTMCAPRQARGEQPACIEACPVQASIFGNRDDLLREAENRLKLNRSGYFQYIYGKEEAGGTSVLYLSAVPFEMLGLPANVPREPLPIYTFRVLSELPKLATLGGVLLGGIWWITRRREEVEKVEHDEEST